MFPKALITTWKPGYNSIILRVARNRQDGSFTIAVEREEHMHTFGIAWPSPFRVHLVDCECVRAAANQKSPERKGAVYPNRNRSRNHRVGVQYTPQTRGTAWHSPSDIIRTK